MRLEQEQEPELRACQLSVHLKWNWLSKLLAPFLFHC
jgi:hypothetical protein